jgi:hypothetical protein
MALKVVGMEEVIVLPWWVLPAITGLAAMSIIITFIVVIARRRNR